MSDFDHNHAGDGCAFCARMKQATMTEAAWRAVHEPHLHRRGGEEFETKPLEHAPEGYPAHWLVCPCGAQLLTKKGTRCLNDRTAR